MLSSFCVILLADQPTSKQTTSQPVNKQPISLFGRGNKEAHTGNLAVVVSFIERKLVTRDAKVCCAKSEVVVDTGLLRVQQVVL